MFWCRKWSQNLSTNPAGVQTILYDSWNLNIQGPWHHHTSKHWKMPEKNSEMRKNWRTALQLSSLSRCAKNWSSKHRQFLQTVLLVTNQICAYACSTCFQYMYKLYRCFEGAAICFDGSYLKLARLLNRNEATSISISTCVTAHVPCKFHLRDWIEPNEHGPINKTNIYFIWH